MGSNSPASKMNLEQFSQSVCLEHKNSRVSEALSRSSSIGGHTSDRRGLKTESDHSVSLQQPLLSSLTWSSATSQKLGVSVLLPYNNALFYFIIQQLPTSTKDISRRLFLHLHMCTRTSGRRLSMSMIVLSLSFILLSLNVCHIESKSVGLCRGIPCANGGRLMLSNSVWGDCRCRCRRGFVGPYCQYQAARKRSANSASISNDRRLLRSEEMETIRLRLLALRQRLDRLEANQVQDVQNSTEAEQVNDVVSNQQAETQSDTLRRLRRSWFLINSTR